MAIDPAKTPRLQSSDSPVRGLGIGTLFGIGIRLDASLILIFALMVYLLGINVFPAWHPDWPATTSWLTALAAGILFFASVLAHELAHALVSRHFGIEVRRITLFLFGGLAEMEEEPGQPRAEFLIAIAGPLTSLVLGLLFLVAAISLAGADFGRLIVDDQEAALASLSPVASTMMWLGPVNIVLALFNMVPGFPLDGGRVFRAAIWWLTGDLRRATRIAADSGRWCGWLLMILGITQALSGLLLQGLWLLMIGWFLANAAATSYQQVVIKDLLKGISARDLMRSHFETVTAQLRVADFIDSYLLQSSQLLWPVIEDNRLIGLVTLAEVKDTPPEDRAGMTVGQVMRTDLDALTLPADTDVNRALAALGTRHTPLAVVAGSRVVGLLSQLDVMKWLQLHQEAR
jgi:Zn-dependent protease/predicted transcriptional regulator